MRWWTTWRTAEPVVKSVSREQGIDGVGTALLGLHALGADVLRELSARTCVDADLVAQTLAEVEFSTVAKAYSDAVMPGSDYGWLRIGPIKRDADAAAVRMVSTLVSKGVAWPMALERAAEGYGLPGEDALQYAQKVAAAVVNPRVLADHADEHLALFATEVCKAESDAPQEFTKAEDEWVVIRRNGRAYRQQVARDDQGQFASEPQTDQQAMRDQRAAKAKQRRAAGRQRRAGMHQANAKQAQQRSQQRAQRAQASFDALSQATPGAQPRAAQARTVSDNEAVRQRIRSKVAQRLDRRMAQRQAQYQKRLREQLAQMPVHQVIFFGSADWLKAGKENWPIESDPGTWARTGPWIAASLEQDPVWDPVEYERVTESGEKVAPVLSVTPDGMKVLLAAATDPDHTNQYVDLVSLEAASQSAGKDLYKLRWLPTKAPMVQMPMSRSDDLWINLRLKAAYENGVQDHASDPETMEPWVHDDDWGKSVEFSGYPFQRIRMDMSRLIQSGASLAHIDDLMKSPGLYEALGLAMNYSTPRLRSMAQVVADIETDDSGSADLSNYDQEMVGDLIAHDIIDMTRDFVVDPDDGTEYPKYEISHSAPPLLQLLRVMNANLAGPYDSLSVGYTPTERVDQLAAHAGVDERIVRRYRERGPDVMSEYRASADDDYTGDRWDYGS